MGVVAAVVVATAYTVDEQKKSAKKAEAAQNRRAEEARQDALAAEIQARESEVFSETEGEGQGTLGEIRSGISTEIDDEEDTQIRQGTSSKSVSSLSI